MKKSPWTIEQISIGLFAVLLPVVLLLGATNVVRIWQAYKTERHKTEEAFSAGIETLQGKLDKPERYIADFLTQASELQTLSSTVNEPDRYVAKNTVYENFGSYLAQNDSVLLLALYCEDTDIYIERDNGLRYLSIQGRAVLRNTLREEFPKNCKEAEASSRWCAVQAGEHVLLYRVMHLQKRYMLCCIDLSAWADAASHSVEAGSTILIRCDGTLQGSNAAQYAEVLADLTPDSSKLIRSGSLLAVSKPFYNAELIFLANNDIALRSSVLLSQISAVISIGCVLVAGILLFAWRKTILLPLRSLKKTMELIREGKLEERAVDANAGAELQEINDTFNQMMSNIHQLKIEGYEKELRNREIQLEYYHLQIRPHFYLNCLKNIYALAFKGDTERLSRSILLTSDYLRHTLQQNFQTISLSAEVLQCQNYAELIGISAVRPPLLTCRIEENVRDFPVPAVSLLTLVENSIKYASVGDRTLHIEINAQKFAMEDGHCLYIRIHDNGPGFTEKSLAVLNETDWNSDASTHIGIRNVLQRFRLMYGGEGHIAFYNEDGAVVELYIPIKEGGKDESLDS